MNQGGDCLGTARARVVAGFNGRGVGVSLALLMLAGCAEGSWEDPGQATVPRFVAHDDAIEGRYVVVMRDDNVDSPTALAATYHGAVAAQFGARHRGFVAQLGAEDAMELAADPRVLFVEQDTAIYATATQANAPWGLDRIDQVSLPLDGAYGFEQTGSGVSAYVVDSGIRVDHVDFGGRAVEGYTVINDGRGAADCGGHGTHVAGTVGGDTFGVAKGAELVSVRVLDCQGDGTMSGLIEALEWVRNDASGPSVVNMSLSGGNSPALQAAVDDLVEAGIVVVAAAGNEGADACSYSPANTPSAITVGASDDGDRRANFSNYGDCLDLYAPGVGIESAAHTSPNGSVSFNGTSMAAPHVAGAVALVLEANPGATPEDVETWMAQRSTGGIVGGHLAGADSLLHVADLSLPGGGSPGPNPMPQPDPDPEPMPGPDPEPMPNPPAGDCVDACDAAVSLCNSPPFSCEQLCSIGLGDVACWNAAQSCLDGMFCL